MQGIGIAKKRMIAVLCALFAMCVFGEDISVAERIKLAQAGNADAQFQLGMCYLEGNGVDTNYDAAVEWLYAAAKQGHSEAQAVLSLENVLVMGGADNGDKLGRKFLDVLLVKSVHVAAEKGDAESQFELGCHYANGKVVAKDDVKAVQWCREAAEQGHAGALFRLGICYDKGICVERNHAKAIQLYRRAAELGYSGADPMFSCWGNLAIFLCLCIVLGLVFITPIKSLWGRLEDKEKSNVRHVNGIVKPAALKLAIGWLYCAWGGLSVCMALAFVLIVGMFEKYIDLQDSPGLKNFLCCLFVALVFLLTLCRWIMVKCIRKGEDVKNGIGGANESQSRSKAEDEAIHNDHSFVKRIKAGASTAFGAFILVCGFMQFLQQLSFAVLMMAIGAGLGCCFAVLVFWGIKCISIGSSRSRILFSLFHTIAAVVFSYNLSLYTNDVTMYFIVSLVTLVFPILLIWTPKVNGWFRRINDHEGCTM